MDKLEVGDKVPDVFHDFIQLSDKKVVLYFYPKDNTPGCTQEACNLRDNYLVLVEKGYEVYGVSPDTEKSHQSFSQKYSLPFKLIADPEKKLILGFNAWGEKKMYGKSYEGILRKTFVIGSDGNILKIIDKVDTKDHTSQILD